MIEPLISVIVPVYKVEAYLRRCVDSICNQTYRNLEIILVDDGSPDRCGELCDMLATEDSRIRVIHKENGGLSDARNAGLDSMTGEYVGFVDSDDWVEADMYRLLYQRMISEDADISCSGLAFCQDGKERTFQNPNLQECFTIDPSQAQLELIQNKRITNSMCDKLFRAEIFSGLRMKKGIIYEDFQIQPYCLSRARRITYTAVPCYCYFMSDKSISRGNYSLKQYDYITNSRERIQYYREYYPQCVVSAQVTHLDICLSAIYKATGIVQWKTLRKELVTEVCAPLSDEVRANLTRKVKWKRTLLKYCPPLYVVLMRLYDLLMR